MFALLIQGLIISHCIVSSLVSWFLRPEHSSYISVTYVMTIHNFLQSFRQLFLSFYYYYFIFYFIIYFNRQTYPMSISMECYSFYIGYCEQCCLVHEQFNIYVSLTGCRCHQVEKCCQTLPQLLFLLRRTLSRAQDFN